MKLLKPAKKRQYRYQIEGYSPDGKFNCAEISVIEAMSFDDAVSKLKKHMEKKNKVQRREGFCEYSEITGLKLCDFSREEDE